MTGYRLWFRDLAMGARFAGAGGRAGKLRTAFTVLGIALGTALLLLATSVPNLLEARDIRGAARMESTVPTDTAAGPHTLLVMSADTQFHDEEIRGRLMQAEGADPEIPPGLHQLPPAGTMVVSPKLDELLNSSDGKLLRERLPYEITGHIADSGLTGPSELAYVAGSTSLTTDTAERVDGFGKPRISSPLGALLTLLAVTVFVALLAPVVVFVAVASRFGASTRDRRMAVLRLVGADRPMLRRLTAGEALATALGGTAVGVAFFLIGRQFARFVVLWDVSVFPGDITPPVGLGALVLVAVPAASVAASLIALRGVTVEPLGVARRVAVEPKHSWLRLLPAVGGLLLLLPMLRDARATETVSVYRLAFGILLILMGVTAILPWVVRALTARLGAGPTPWLLGMRRLRAETSASVRVVNSIAVAVAGAIAVQTLLSGLESSFTKSTGYELDRADSFVSLSANDRSLERLGELAATPGVALLVPFAESAAALPGDAASMQTVVVADCPALRELVSGVTDCVPGDVFTVGLAAAQTRDSGSPGPIREAGDGPGRPDPSEAAPGIVTPGSLLQVHLPGGAEQSVPWTVPATAKELPAGDGLTVASGRGVYATPEALAGTGYRILQARAYAKLDPAVPDGIEHLRNAVAQADPGGQVYSLKETTEVRKYTNIKRGLFIGATLTLVLIGASMLVSTLEQLREQRRPLAVLAALGTSHRTLALSVLAQTAVPLVVGLTLAAASGIGLGMLLLGLAGRPLLVDWTYVGAITGLGGGAVLAVALAGLPPLWRLVRPENLRTE
ncbi:FtsX-like permease family protein [Yinghuangia sp. YIM S09857]|uniref:FtsX-like permease family protein n=1 Tax=Yinghuangia sp. YIM S09857 TaxID=3436929 RepID=UPI003F52FDE5